MAKKLLQLGGGIIAAVGAVGTLIAVTANPWPWLVPASWTLLIAGLVVLTIGFFLKSEPPAAVRSTSIQGHFEEIDVDEAESSADVFLNASGKRARIRRLKHTPPRDR